MAGSGCKNFAYLTPKVSSLPLALTALAQLPGFKLVHVPDMKVHDVVKYSAPSLLIKTTPLNMRAVLSQVDLVISQGGAGVSSLCVLTGVRHVMVPTQMEQRMLTRQLVAKGLAYGVDPDMESPDYAGIFKRALSCPVLAKNIERLKLAYADFDQDEQIDALAEELLEPLP